MLFVLCWFFLPFLHTFYTLFTHFLYILHFTFYILHFSYLGIYSVEKDPCSKKIGLRCAVSLIYGSMDWFAALVFLDPFVHSSIHPSMAEMHISAKCT